MKKYRFKLCSCRAFWLESLRVINRWMNIMDCDSCSRLQIAMRVYQS